MDKPRKIILCRTFEEMEVWHEAEFQKLDMAGRIERALRMWTLVVALNPDLAKKPEEGAFVLRRKNIG